MSLISRLTSTPYGIIRRDGNFKSDYMYYYFLGKYLSGAGKEGREALAEMSEGTFREENYLTVLFAIHHSSDDAIVDDILSRTEESLCDVPPARLTAEETRRFESVVADLPGDVLSKKSPQENRRDERVVRSEFSDGQVDSAEEDSEPADSDRMSAHRILKNNKLMGQVLRNRHGNLEKVKIERVVEIVADSGLRLVNFILADEQQIAHQAANIHTRIPDLDLSIVKRVVEIASFVWTISNVELIVQAINVPAIKDAIDSVVARKDTPAYDIVGYFRQLDSAQGLTISERDRLSELLRKHNHLFIKRVASIRTQHYINTHRSIPQVEQSIFSLLSIEYSQSRLHATRFSRRS